MSKLGEPKYNLGDKVSFIISGRIIEGTIYIVDRYGTFEFPDEVCYDIMGRDAKYVDSVNVLGECLYKHVREHEIIED